MTKREFLDILGRALKRELSDREVEENLLYYSNYIEREIENGKSEDQVLTELGDPRLIARTILSVDQQREETESFEESDGFEDNVRVHTFSGMKVWGIVILAVLLVFLILGTIFAVLWKLLPFILLAAVIMWIYRRFFS